MSAAQVYKIDVARNLVYLLGSVPGPQGGVVRMVDGTKASSAEQLDALYDLPMPTWLPSGEEGEQGADEPTEIIMPLGAVDPLQMSDI